MAENIFTMMNIGGQGMSLQRKRLNAVANNIANVNTTKDIDGLPYKREIVVSNYKEGRDFGEELETSLQLARTNKAHSPNTRLKPDAAEADIVKGETVKDATAERLVYDPSHPDADADGYVHYPDINIVTEMVDMITAQRGFEANTQVISAAKNLARFSLEI